MRELEFLPSWYTQLRQRRRIVRLESWAFTGLSLAVAGWMVAATCSTRASHAALGSVRTQLNRIYDEKKVLSEQLSLRTELSGRQQVVDAVGRPVEISRVLNTLEKAMAREMSLTDFSCETVEQIRRPVSVAATSTPDAGEVERVMKVKVTAVAPSNLDLANFLTSLNLPFIQNVALSYSRDRIDSGHVMREFEVTFTLNLSLPGVPQS